MGIKLLVDGMNPKRLGILIISISLLCLVEALVAVVVYDLLGKVGITGQVAVGCAGAVCALWVGAIALVGQARKKT